MRIQTIEEAKELLTEYDQLDSLDEKLNWAGYDKLPETQYICPCGKVTTYPQGIDDLRRTIEKGWEWKLVYHFKECLCIEPQEEEEETEDDD